MDALRLVFDPLAPVWLIAALALAAGLVGILALRRRVILRLFAIAAFAGALANPALVREEREALSDTVVLVTDASESMGLAERPAAREAAAGAVRAAVEADPTLSLVEAEAPPGEDGTLLFDALARALGEAPRERIAGVITITDGRVHDAPQTPDALRIDAPVHALIVGARQTRDRRLEIVRAPQFGIVGEETGFVVRIDDPSAAPGERALVTLSVDGEDPITASAEVGVEVEVVLRLERRGPNVVELNVEAAPDELTLVNNRAAVSVAGVRDRLRVMLVTGEPHAGARAWRDLLKSDPAVDLVHFTILRPPDKVNRAPERELSLIAFPTHELFAEKLEDFDLVIFDRYRRRDVIYMQYLNNIAEYVDNGGALLVAAGPAFASPSSLFRTPLAAVLPGQPAFGAVINEGYYPTVTEVGRRHPVTATLSRPENEGAPTWGRWFRQIDVTPIKGETVLEGADGRPLLMLDRVGEGRVALLLSDHAWLWSRGVEGGGPHGELFRRLAHWLMREPELEEERLEAAIAAGALSMERRTMGPAPQPAEVTTPTGTVLQAPLIEREPGVYVADLPVQETGLYRVRSGEETAVAAAGPLNPREFADLRPTDAVLAPLVARTGGGTFFIGEGADVALPDIRRTRARADAAQAGRAWLGLQRNEAYAARATSRQPLAPALLVVALLLAAATLAWAREGK